MRGRGTNRSAAWVAAACALAAALALVLGLSACGGSSSEATAGGVGIGAVAGTVQPAPAREGKKVGGESCAAQVGEFIDSMATLRGDLVAGLGYEDYVAEVESIRGAYHHVPVGKLALECLRAAGTPGENGLNKYIEASNTWTECVETAGCESATVEPALQSRWRQASKLLSKAQQGLKSLEKSPKSS